MLYAVSVMCKMCGMTFDKSLHRYNESIKRGWLFYCSKKCFNKSKERQSVCVCDNLDCRKEFTRKNHDIRPYFNYCSRTCANIVNGKKYPNRNAKLKSCVICTRDFPGPNKCCSKACREIYLKSQEMNEEDIVLFIQDFNTKKGRIPFKSEFPQAKTARVMFGTWNKAIIAAGFEPNPVKFSKKYKAQVGHICDSFSEKIIDDWLSKNGIPHEVHAPYENSKFVADFVIGGKYIEFVGLEGEHKIYNNAIKRKRELWRSKNINVVEIHPKDLFPRNKLGTVLKDLVK